MTVNRLAFVILHSDYGRVLGHRVMPNAVKNMKNILGKFKKLLSVIQTPNIARMAAKSLNYHFGVIFARGP